MGSFQLGYTIQLRVILNLGVGLFLDLHTKKIIKNIISIGMSMTNRAMMSAKNLTTHTHI